MSIFVCRPLPAVAIAMLLSASGLALGQAIPNKNIMANPGMVVRNIDGSVNNTRNSSWGAVGVTLQRSVGSDYSDGRSAPAGENRPSPREISNTVVAASGEKPNSAGASDYIWQWGQFLDHDLDLTEGAHPAEPFNIEVPAGDPFFDPTGSGTAVIPLNRSEFIIKAGVREQVNQITAFIDASNVYGSDVARATALRTNDGTGKLKTSAGNLLPFNTAGLPNAPAPSPEFFLAGDLRANEQVGLTALHTLFVREHNWLAEQIADQFPSLSGEEIYQFARAIVGAEMQAITYNEFLPVLVGSRTIPRYSGYKANVNPSIENAFSTAAYRFGHSMLSNTLLRLKSNGTPIAEGNIPLQNAFFNPASIVATGIEPLLRGLAVQKAQEIDNEIVDGVRNFLFGPPGAGGFDLGSLNIQRGRDHGLPSYNAVRVAVGLQPVTEFHHITGDFALATKLESLYGNVDDIDLWVGGLADLKHPRSMLGRTFHKVVVDQFTKLRDGDRFWYERTLPSPWVSWVNRQTLSKIIKRNTTIGNELPADVFKAQSLH